VIGHQFHRAVGKGHGGVRAIRNALLVQAVLKAHNPHAHRAVFLVGHLGFFHRIEVNVDHVVEHAHGDTDGALELVGVEFAILQVVGQVDRTQVAHRDFFRVGV